MAIDERLAGQVRAALTGTSPVTEVKMFGGIGFMLAGNMVAAASDRGLLVRVGKDGEAEALSRAGAQPMVMNGRTMTGYVRIERNQLDARSVRSWVRLARGFVQTLPPRKTALKPKRKRMPR